MRTRDTSGGAPCWIDLSTSDPNVARRFYADLFGWTAQEPNPDFGGYFMFTDGDVPVAGGMAAQPGGVGDAWSVYLTSTDTQKTLEAATKAGGQVVAPAMPVADLGTMAVVVDPGGASIGVWQPDQFSGIPVTGEPGLPSWFELHTTQYDKEVSFYRDVFGWATETMADSPEFRYTTLTHGTESLAGIMDASGWADGASLGWSVYFWVDDADAALRKVTELGGKVVREAEDTPYGRLAAAADPLGAQFKLMAANDAMPAQS